MAEALGQLHARAFLAKARQHLAAAETDYAAERHDACANRAYYYYCFQAAMAALLMEGIRPAATAGRWSHEFIQGDVAPPSLQRLCCIQDCLGPADRNGGHGGR